jgi:hypothetical protein
MAILTGAGWVETGGLLFDPVAVEVAEFRPDPPLFNGTNPFPFWVGDMTLTVGFPGPWKKKYQ